MHTALLVFLACLGKSISVLMLFFYITLHRNSIKHYIQNISPFIKVLTVESFLLSVSSLFSRFNDF